MLGRAAERPTASARSAQPIPRAESAATIRFADTAMRSVGIVGVDSRDIDADAAASRVAPEQLLGACDSALDRINLHDHVGRVTEQLLLFLEPVTVRVDRVSERRNGQAFCVGQQHVLCGEGTVHRFRRSLRERAPRALSA